MFAVATNKIEIDNEIEQALNNEEESNFYSDLIKLSKKVVLILFDNEKIFRVNITEKD